MTQLLYAKYSFDAVSNDELSFRRGEVIEVLETDEEFGDGKLA
jgi:SH3 domain